LLLSLASVSPGVIAFKLERVRSSSTEIEKKRRREITRGCSRERRHAIKRRRVRTKLAKARAGRISNR
jgi:hypothetical protein